MKSYRPSITTLILSALILFSSAYAQNFPIKPAAFNGRFEGYPNACISFERQRIEAEIQVLATNHEPALASRLAHEMLCGDNYQSYKYVISHTAETIRSVDTERYDEHGHFAAVQVAGAAIVLARRKAWNVHVSGLYAGGIGIEFSDGGPCISNFEIGRPSTHWVIVAAGVICD
ncbi:hypothetical protein [Herbaspirillum sp. VT-16-41]|uniref:hypothetical protein n=1 Tax=Herbaspirillum sp. VT-16-41 TaxID=1953765 RepID=UPI0011154C91|nr:hypothetical protein [Herbaspirillum sp. VT-16-41]